MKDIFILLLLLTVACGSATGQAGTEQADKVVVYKSKRQMQLLRAEKVLRTYRVALGDNPVGHKRQEGDEKTPEGDYVLDWRNPNSLYYKSIHISYPNAQDRQQARRRGVSPGGDIMIHGRNGPVVLPDGTWKWKDWTDGCIAVTNAEMDEIWKMVKNGTPIQIHP
ncbi:MAG: L,D-transpeptidase family protein [Cytophagales bacterium]|nr:L,D-transpeptidase family protein [Cytophagales bacterium]